MQSLLMRTRDPEYAPPFGNVEQRQKRQDRPAHFLQKTAVPQSLRYGRRQNIHGSDKIGCRHPMQPA